jgi:hypothetical protein
MMATRTPALKPLAIIDKIIKKAGLQHLISVQVFK